MWYAWMCYVPQHLPAFVHDGYIFQIHTNLLHNKRIHNISKFGRVNVHIHSSTWCTAYSTKRIWWWWIFRIQKFGLSCNCSQVNLRINNGNRVAGVSVKKVDPFLLPHIGSTYSFRRIALTTEHGKGLHNCDTSNDSIGRGNSRDNVTSHSCI